MNKNERSNHAEHQICVFGKKLADVVKKQLKDGSWGGTHQAWHETYWSKVTTYDLLPTTYYLLPTAY